MTHTKLFAFAIIVLIRGTNGIADDMSPDELMKKVEATYAAMQTYKSEGTITTDMDTGGMKMKTETAFSILLKKPNLYLISWTQENMPMPGMDSSGAVWSDGTQPYLYMGSSMMNTYSKMTSDEMALGGATGISGGAAFTIPAMFLQVFNHNMGLSNPEYSAPFRRLKDPTIEGSEMIGGEDCYVLTGPSATSKVETFWISKTSYLIRQAYETLDTPEGGTETPAIPTGAQLEETMRSMGLEVTEESKKNMKQMMESSRTMLKNMKLKGSSTELHTSISSPELNKSDFKFDLPEGAVLKDSLFGGMLDGNEGVSNKSLSDETRWRLLLAMLVTLAGVALVIWRRKLGSAC